MRNELVIRPPVAGDREPWERLWQDYLRFYRAHLEPAVDHAW